MAATQKSKQPAAKNGKQKANQQKEKIIGLIALIVVAFAGGAKVFGCAPAVDSNASATVSFLDVGQGDSVLIQAAGKTVLIDGGERDQGSVVLDDLKKYGTVTVDEDMVIVCVVGDLEWDNIGFEARIVQAMKDVPVRMISYGGSNFNVSLLVKAADKRRALQALSDHLFNNK